jgi:hypothetical protein
MQNTNNQLFKYSILMVVDGFAEKNVCFEIVLIRLRVKLVPPLKLRRHADGGREG